MLRGGVERFVNFQSLSGRKNTDNSFVIRDRKIGVTWFALLLTTLALDQHDVLLGAWVVNNLVQNDQEVPCRDEVDKVNIWRAAAGFGLWFVAVLALVPLDHVLV